MIYPRRLATASTSVVYVCMCVCIDKGGVVLIRVVVYIYSVSTGPSNNLYKRWTKDSRKPSGDKHTPVQTL